MHKNKEGKGYRVTRFWIFFSFSFSLTTSGMNIETKMQCIIDRQTDKQTPTNKPTNLPCNLGYHIVSYRAMSRHRPHGTHRTPSSLIANALNSVVSNIMLCNAMQFRIDTSSWKVVEMLEMLGMIFCFAHISFSSLFHFFFFRKIHLFVFISLVESQRL
ncbi:hypothetical protein VTN77DRAFT_598 [Rasamsonia byssochlamydoides]|uniref:uncharacterized protein n=1 Tax=Rasamsonia byssochlamydoides TaxID=89139 RepID=UPI003743E299